MLPLGKIFTAKIALEITYWGGKRGKISRWYFIFFSNCFNNNNKNMSSRQG
jgi:hypothetical protein